MEYYMVFTEAENGDSIHYGVEILTEKEYKKVLDTINTVFGINSKKFGNTEENLNYYEKIVNEPRKYSSREFYDILIGTEEIKITEDEYNSLKSTHKFPWGYTICDMFYEILGDYEKEHGCITQDTYYFW